MTPLDGQLLALLAVLLLCVLAWAVVTSRRDLRLLSLGTAEPMRCAS